VFAAEVVCKIFEFAAEVVQVVCKIFESLSLLKLVRNRTQEERCEGWEGEREGEGGEGQATSEGRKAGKGGCVWKRGKLTGPV
jgi:hypothetical protein